MEFPASYPALTWVLMGGLGTISSILVSIVLWRWISSGMKFKNSEPTSSYTTFGLIFLYASGLVCCGIAGPPGYALSSDPSLVSREWIFRASMLSNVFAVVGWASILIGQARTIKLYQELLAKEKSKLNETVETLSFEMEKV